LASYAAREAESEDPEETKRQEEAAARRLAEKVKAQKAKARENGTYRAVSPPTSPSISTNEWAAPQTPVTPSTAVEEAAKSPVVETPAEAFEIKGKDKEGTPVRKFRGVPEDVQLFEVFWKQVVELIKVSDLLLCLISTDS